MRRFGIGSAAGIPIKLDLTFLIILPVFAALIGFRIDRTAELFNEHLGAGLAVDALVGPVTPWVLGAIAAVGLFVGVLAHEFGHALVALRYGYEIDSITLWLFGGLAALADTPENWRHELLIAIAGPIVSIAVGIVCYSGFLLVPETIPQAQYVLLYLGVLNVALAGFNMLPAFPMDGGRVLRALLGRSRPFARATEIAARVGRLFAIVMAIVGLAQLNIVLVGIAVFVYIAARSEQQQVTMRAALDGVVVDDVMTPASNLQTVSPTLTVEELLQRMFRERHTGYPVVYNGRPIGMVTLDDAQSVREEERAAFLVEDVMSDSVNTVRPETPAMDAIKTIQEHGQDRLLVVNHRSDVVGLVSRTDLLTAIDIIKSGGSVHDDTGTVPTGRY